MKVWIATSALKKPSQTEVTIDGGMAQAKSIYYRPGEWFANREEAVAQTLELIKDKRIAIAKQLAKLDKLQAELEAGK